MTLCEKIITLCGNYYILRSYYIMRRNKRPTPNLIHCYLPQGLMDTKIIPLVKNKCGKLSDKNNYRPVAISNSLSKVFELILLDRLDVSILTRATHGLPS